jgi:HK97 gp10 family phage protein
VSVTVKLENADKLTTKLRAYLLSSQTKVKAVVAGTLLDIESTAKELAPVDTGLLRSGIHANITGTYAGSVTSEAKYAVHVEFGTRKMAAQPHLYPAYFQHKAAFLANLKQAVKFNLF